MSDARDIWREKSDDELLEAAAALDEFTEEGKSIIRAEYSSAVGWRTQRSRGVRGERAPRVSSACDARRRSAT